MKVLKMFFSILLIAIVFVSCKKDNTPTINGTWVGKFGENNETPTYFYKFVIKSGGVLQRLDNNNQVVATGTWQLSGAEFKGNYIFSDDNYKFSLSGLYTDFNGEMIGTWGTGNNSTNGGKFNLKKQ